MSAAADNSAWKSLTDHARETALLASIQGLLGWDQQTYMPTAAGPFRAEQISHFSGLLHRRETDPRIGEWLGELATSPLAKADTETGATIAEMARVYAKKTRLTAELVTELSRACALGEQAWSEARAKADYPAFKPYLARILKLKREVAESLGYEDSIYDALLDEFEPHAKTRDIAKVLSSLKDELIPLVAECGASKRKAPVEIVYRVYPTEMQRAFGSAAAEQIGFDFRRGRLDVTHHPFCGGAGPDDIRITTRYDERFFNSAFFSILHEAGHGLYEQGLRSDQFGLPLGEAASLGIHESQSRMWENIVGRSRPFWKHFFPEAQASFPDALGDVSLDDFYFAINEVRPSLIRVEADEVSYNLHILIRFELELALLNDELSLDELPAAWNAKYEQYLGIRPTSDAEGVLQDVHWSFGAFGYFPTYTLGNLCASQLYEKAVEDLGDLDAMFAKGEFRPLLDWLRTNIHTVGRRYSATQLIERVTGKPLSSAPLLRHLRGKFGGLYLSE